MSLKTLPLKSLAAVVGAALALAVPATSNAGLLVSSAQGCDSQTLSQPFVPFGDVAQYTLDPGGNFESGASSWNGGNVVSGNEPWDVGSDSDSQSLALADGSSAVSPPICVGIQHPDLRFFAKGGPLSSLRVDVLFEDASGTVRSLPVGTLVGTGGWTLSPTYLIAANLLPLLPGDKTAVSFRFTASGNWRIDDVYVDPFTRW